MGFVAADFAKHVESWTNEQIVARVMGILGKIYGNIPDPVNVHITRWGSDPFARGSYSFMKVHSTPQHVQDLGRPVGRVHFAGEATAKYPGYTHGAFMSAKREVERILVRQREEKRTVALPNRGIVSSTQLIPVLTSKL
jgi:monoamine oxidase